MRSPCAKDCPDRKQGCHAKCEKYLEYYQHNREKNKKAQAEVIATNFTRDSVTKNVKLKQRERKRR